jgi:2-dehydro-3-deoxygalactonokinase
MTQDMRLLGLDWGTTSLRAYLFGADGTVLDARQGPWGIMALPGAATEGGYDQALEQLCGDWLQREPGLPIVAAGMVGSAQGWREAPYIECPAGESALARSLATVRTRGGLTVHIVPGMIAVRALPDVMRGEETQVIGALACKPGMETQGGVRMILPGTHSKWVQVEHGLVRDFTTCMTGEVYAALTGHTILGRLMPREQASGPVDWVAFEQGLAIAMDERNGGLLTAIFSVRTLGLTHKLAPAQLPDYLSGLLIGYEIAGMQAIPSGASGAPLLLIGAEGLVQRYARALPFFGLTGIVVHGATEAGLWRIAGIAGIITRTT